MFDQKFGRQWIRIRRRQRDVSVQPDSRKDLDGSFSL